MKPRAELEVERKLCFSARNALRRQLHRDQNERLKLETMIADLENQKESLESEVRLMRDEQAEGMRKLEAAVTVNNSKRVAKSRTVTQLNNQSTGT